MKFFHHNVFQIVPDIPDIQIFPKMKLLLMLTTITLLLVGQNGLECGVPRRQRRETVHLILHGRESMPGKWPWHVALFHSFDYACGGTLISTTHVLTAAHCTINRKTGYPINRKNLFVDAGAHDLHQMQHRQRHSVRAIHKFDNYTQDSHRYDITILELDSEVELNRYVQPARVFVGEELDGLTGTAVGWGLTETDEGSSILREAQLPVIDFITCLSSNRAAFGPTLEKEMFCAGYTNGTGLCNGDSGGGLFLQINGTWHLGGIVSFTKARDENDALCQTAGYSVFTKIYWYLPWIKRLTELEGLIGEGDTTKSRYCESKDASAVNSGKRKLPRQCGVYYPSRIVFGQRTRVFEFPWMALLTRADGYWVTVGSLIHNRYVLTGAFSARAEHLKRVRLGEHTLDQNIDCNDDDDCASTVREIDIECIIRHPDFKKRTYANDIALVKLAKYVEYEDHIQPICLPTVSKLGEMEPPRYILTGWGRTEEGDDSNVLLKAFITTVDLAGCQDIANNASRPVHLTHDQLCAKGDGLPNAAHGDAGAPLGYPVKFNGIRFVQLGIVSYHLRYYNGTERRIYTKVAPYMDWILANIET